jgi:hypothetical protein
VIDEDAGGRERSPAISCDQTRRIDEVLALFFITPTEALVLMAIAAAVVFIGMSRSRVKKRPRK